MTRTQFNQLITGTKIGSPKKPGDAEAVSLKAARLYFIDGIPTIAECARQANTSAQNARVTINEIKRLIEAQGLQAVRVLVPRGQRRAIESLAAKMVGGSGQTSKTQPDQL